MKVVRLLITLTMLLAYEVGAQSCDSLKISGGAHWFPFFFTELPTEEALLSRTSRTMLENRNGIVGDTVLQAANQLGIKINLSQPRPWRRVLFDLSEGYTDVLAGSLKTEERAELFEFSEPVYQSEVRVFVRGDKSFEFSELSDLKGRIGLKLGGMSLGGKSDRYAFEHLVIEEVANTESLFRMLHAKRADYAVFHLNSGIEQISKLGFSGDIIPLPKMISREPIYVAFSKKSRCANEIRQLQAEISRMLKDGRIGEITSFYQSIIEMPPGATLHDSKNQLFAFLWGMR